MADGEADEEPRSGGHGRESGWRAEARQRRRRAEGSSGGVGR